MTVSQALIWATNNLKQANTKSALLDAEVLLMKVIKKDRAFLYAQAEKELTQLQENKFKKYISRRVKGEPVAYILEHKEFYGLDFEVNKNTLIPRPATETLVDEVIKQIRSLSGIAERVFIDIGTGSGCIPVAVLKNAVLIKTYAIDFSKPALEVAKKNAKQHGVLNKINFLQGDLLCPFCHPDENRDPGFCHNKKSKIIISANLPYLIPEQYKNNPELKFEPKSALVAGKDGLKYYKKLFKQIDLLIKKNQTEVVLIIEIDPAQKIKIKKMAKDLWPLSKINFIKDLSGKIRVGVVEI